MAVGAEALEMRALLSSPGLVAAYGFEEGAGANVFDLSGNGNTGAINGATWISTGKFGNALSFNGTSNYVTVPDSSSLHLTTGKTLEAWVYPTSSNGKQDIIIKQGTNIDVYNLYSRSSSAGVPEANVLVGGSNKTALGSALPVNTWTYLAGTYDGTILRLYINGTQVSNLPISGSIVVSSGVLRIGGNSIWGEYFAGRIDEVRIYNRAISAAEIQTDMASPVFTPDAVAPVISNVAATNVIGTAATITWTTDESASSQVDYGPDTAYAYSTTVSQTPLISHSVAISGLSPLTSYHFRVRSADPSANTTVSGDCSFVTLPPPQPVYIFVSPTGNDSNPGTKALPFQTLQHARDVVRTISQNLNGDITIYVGGGTYSLPNTLVLDQTDSGSNGFTITWRNYPGETPVISGGQAISGWTLEGNGIYSAPAGGLSFLQFYVNGLRATLARTPESGNYNTMHWNVSAKTLNVSTTDAAVLQAMPPAQLQQVRITVLGKGGHQETMRIASISGTTITPQEPERTLAFQEDYPPKEDRPYFLDNALTFLDSPGEFYVDPSANRVYYKPRVGEDLSAAVATAPRLDVLLSAAGTIDSPIHDLILYGLTFQETTWTLPLSQGYIGDQASFRYVGPEPKDSEYTGPNPGDEVTSYPSQGIESGVYFAYAHGVRLERNVFKNMGAGAVNFWIDVDDSTFIGNTIQDMAAGGITVEMDLHGNPVDQRTICSNDVIQDNLITRVGLDYYQANAIAATYTDSILIAHNEVSFTPNHGISVGWGWADVNNAARNNIVEYNKVHDVGLLLADAGGIYTLSRQPGTLILANYIYNIVRTPIQGSFNMSAIYLDEGSNLITVQDNVSVNVDAKLFQNANGPSNTLINNNGSSPTTIANSGIEPAYQALAPMATTGTSGDDTIRLTRMATGQVQVQVNSASPTVVNLANLPQWTFDGGGGIDTLIFTGTSGNDDVTFSANHIDFFDEVIPIFTNIESVQYSSGGGIDSLAINGVNLTLADDPTLSALNIGAGSRLDLRNHTLKLSYSGLSPMSQLVDLVALARDGGLWDGAGITSSLADATQFTVGLCDDSAAQQVTMRFTRYGDADLNGVVDTNDLLTVATHWLQSNVGFAEGDFNFDGVVDSTDMGLLAANWQMRVNAPELVAIAAEPPPDPASTDSADSDPTTGDSTTGDASSGQTPDPPVEWPIRRQFDHLRFRDHHWR
jgi:hypothetical protein